MIINDKLIEEKIDEISEAMYELNKKLVELEYKLDTIKNESLPELRNQIRDLIYWGLYSFSYEGDWNTDYILKGERKCTKKSLLQLVFY